MNENTTHISRRTIVSLFIGAVAVLVIVSLILAGKYGENPPAPFPAEVVERRQATPEESARLEKVIQEARERELGEIMKKAAEESRALGR